MTKIDLPFKITIPDISQPIYSVINDNKMQVKKKKVNFESVESHTDTDIELTCNSYFKFQIWNLSLQ